MRARNLFESRPIVFDSVLELGNSSHSKVYALVQDANLVAKLFSKRSQALSAKLTYMVENPPEGFDDPDLEFSLAWPVDLLLRNGPDGPIVSGMIMPRAANSYLVNNCCDVTLRQQQFPDFSYRSLIRVARNLSGAVNMLHQNNIALGYFKESHILVSPVKRVTIVGTDTLQIRDNDNGSIYKSVGQGIEFLPPELQGLSDCDFGPEQDRFALAILIFKLLMEGQHPFSVQGVADDSPQLLAKQICEGKFGFASNIQTQVQAIPSFGFLSPEIQGLFVKCFVDGHNDPAVRPTAENWYKALDRFSASAKSCKTNRQHTFGNHLQSCPWCEIAGKSGVDLFAKRQIEKLQDDKDNTAVVPTAGKRPTTEDPSAATKNRHVSTVPIIKRAKPIKKEKIKIKSAPKQDVISQYDDGSGFILFGRYFEKRKAIKQALIAVIALALLYSGLSHFFGTDTEGRDMDMADSSISGAVVETIPGVNVKVFSLRFFDNSNPDIRREYHDRFKNDQTVAIAWELGIDSTGAVKDSFSVNAIWYDPSGKLLTSQSLNCNVPQTPTMIFYNLGYGKTQAGSWEPGKYTVELQSDGVVIARRTFEVYQ